MMMETITGRGIEAIAFKRVTVTDGDKVRYRVYRSAHDYVVVIAESALMAVKVAGIADPLRIVRDLVSEQSTLPPGEQTHEAQPSVTMSLSPRELKPGEFMIAEAVASSQTPPEFMPLTLGDLQKKPAARMQMLSPAELDLPLPQAQPPAPPLPPLDPPDMGEPVAMPDTGVLSPEQVAQLLGE